MNIVIGAFGCIGRSVARHLLRRGEAERTITTHTDKPNPFGSAVTAFPCAFERPDELMATLRGAKALCNSRRW